MDDLISEFISETSESLALLDRELGSLAPGAQQGDALRTLSTLVHTIKGAAGFLNLSRLETLADAMERALAKGESPTAAPLLDALERIKALVEALATDGEEPAGDDRAIIARLLQAGPETAPVAEPAAPRVVFAEVLETVLEPTAAEPAAQEVVTAAPRGGLMVRAADMGAQLLAMAGALVDTRNQLLALMRSGTAGLDAPVKQLTHMINGLQKQAGQGLVDRQEIARVLVMEAGKQKFAIAQAEVRELVRIGGKGAYRVEMVGNAWLLRLRERLLPLMSLQEMLEMPHAPRLADAQGYVAVMHVGGMDFGVVVDAVHDAEELVIRPLSSIAGPLAMYRGAGLLGDGSIVLQLDMLAIGQVFGARGSAVRLSDGADEAPVEYLMFHAGAGALRAVPLAQVVRLETVDARNIMQAEGHFRMMYQGTPMPLMVLPSTMLLRKGWVNVIVLRHGAAVFGLVVEHIADIATAPAMRRLSAREPYYLGSVMLDGDAVDIVDMEFLANRMAEVA